MTLEHDPPPVPRRRLLVIGVLAAAAAAGGLAVRASNTSRDAAAAASAAAFSSALASASASAAAVVASRSAAAAASDAESQSPEPAPPSPVSAEPGGRLLPDGSRLQLSCPPLATQNRTPDPDATYLARDECGTGQFSLATGVRLRYLTGNLAREPVVGATGNVYWFEPGSCSRSGAVRVLARKRTTVATIASALPPAASGAGPLLSADWLTEVPGVVAWAVTTCAVHPTATGIVVRTASSIHVVSVPAGTVIDGLALSRDGRLAVSFSEDGVGSGLAVVASSAAEVPPARLRPPTGCAWGRAAWSRDKVAVIESCAGDGTHVVRIDPRTGARSAAGAIPGDWVLLGFRGLTNGDLLVSLVNQNRTDRALLRVAGSRVTRVGECPPNACLYQQRTAVP